MGIKYLTFYYFNELFYHFQNIAYSTKLFFFHYDKTFTHEKDEYFMTYLIALIWLRETEDVGEDMDEMKREAETQTRMPEVTKDANCELLCWTDITNRYENIHIRHNG